jgi:hypothetical protein
MKISKFNLRVLILTVHVYERRAGDKIPLILNLFHSQSRKFWRTEFFLPQAEMEICFLGLPARNVVTVLTTLPRAANSG